MQRDSIDDRPPNVHYENDIYYTFQFCNWILKLLGIYPFVYSDTNKFEKIVSVILILICICLLQFVIVPVGNYILFNKEETINMKIKYLGALTFSSTALFKYGYLGIKGSALNRCIKHMERDWKMLADEVHRDIMIKQVTLGRIIISIGASLIYIGGLSYHTIMPLLSKTFVYENYTIRPLTYSGYEAFFDIQKSPSYEIVYCVHCFYNIVGASITIATYSLTAIFTTHACGQIKIQRLRLKNLRKVRKAFEKAVEDCLILVVRDHVEILRFIKDVQNALQEIFLAEIIVSTMLMCIAEYYCLMEWETNRDSVAVLTYFVLLTSFTLSVLIFCYLGELLLEQGDEIENASYETEWYNLPGRKARDIVLVLAMSKYPPKLAAGKVVNLSLDTFSSVLKTSVVYLNVMRKIIEH